MQQRIYWIECLRVIATFAVVWLHISGSVVIYHPSVVNLQWWIGNVADSMSRWCVPIFVMISGYLLLIQPPGISLKAFYTRRLGRLIIPLVFWTMFYLGINFLVGHISVENAIKSVITGDPYFHLWFLYMLVGLYLSAPVIIKFVAISPRRWLLWVTLLCLGLGTVFSLLLPLHVTGTFLDMFPLYIGYFLAGYYIATSEQKPLKLISPIVGFISSILGTALLTGFFLQVSESPWEIMYSYLNPLIMLMSISLFYVMQRMGNDSECVPRLLRESVRILSPLTLGIYLIHPLTMILIGRFFWHTPMKSPLVEIPIGTIMTFAFSAILIAVARLIPGIRRVVI